MFGTYIHRSKEEIEATDRIRIQLAVMSIGYILGIFASKCVPEIALFGVAVALLLLLTLWI